jgi:rubrerythrin
MATLSVGAAVLKVAMNLEELGQQLYRNLSLGCDDSRVAQVCRRLFEDEKKHFAIFEEMCREFSFPTSTPLGDTLERYARRLLKRNILPQPAQVTDVGVGGTKEAALEMALQMERRSVRFFRDLRKLMPQEEMVISRIIQEEISHEEIVKGLMQHLGES